MSSACIRVWQWREGGRIFAAPSGRDDEALLTADKALLHHPTYTSPYILQALAFLPQRKFQQAENALAKCNTHGCGEIGRPALGYMYAVWGRGDEAMRVLDSLIAHGR